jgi:hypothetical protein
MNAIFLAIKTEIQRYRELDGKALPGKRRKAYRISSLKNSVENQLTGPSSVPIPHSSRIIGPSALGRLGSLTRSISLILLRSPLLRQLRPSESFAT